MDMHHLINDGMSINIFGKQLCDILNGDEIETETYDYYDYANDEHILPETEQFFEERMTSFENANKLLPEIYEDNVSIATISMTRLLTNITRSPKSPQNIIVNRISLTPINGYPCRNEENAAIQVRYDSALYSPDMMKNLAECIGNYG